MCTNTATWFASTTTVSVVEASTLIWILPWIHSPHLKDLLDTTYPLPTLRASDPSRFLAPPQETR